MQDEDGDMISISYIRLYYYTLSKPVCIYYTGYAHMDIYIYCIIITFIITYNDNDHIKTVGITSYYDIVVILCHSYSKQQEKDADNTLDSWNYTIFGHLFGEFLSFKRKQSVIVIH